MGERNRRRGIISNNDAAAVEAGVSAHSVAKVRGAILTGQALQRRLDNLGALSRAENAKEAERKAAIALARKRSEAAKKAAATRAKNKAAKGYTGSAGNVSVG